MSILLSCARLYKHDCGMLRALLMLIYQPSVRCSYLVFVCARSRGPFYWAFRNILLALHGVDVGRGAKLGCIKFPHPTSIVIGKGVIIEDGTEIYQNVTIGHKRGNYPVIRRNSVIYPGCVIIGAVEINEEQRVKALSFIEV